jgi:TfoX/Sxy family transcriptional regulator of competence genes
MAYSKPLADEIRARIGDHPGLSERQMFGGIAFMLNGNMAVGVSGDDLMVRVGKDAHDEAISLPGARIFDMSARPMRGWILVAPEGIASDADLDAWIDRGVAWAEALPSK